MRPVSIRQEWPLLLLFLAVVLGMGLVVGLVAPPGEYVRNLDVPATVLPDAAASVLWLVLAVAFAVVGWRCWTLDSNSTAMRLWLAVLILSWWFSPAFFIMRQPLLALLIATAMCVLTAWLVWRLRSWDRLSFWLLLPSLVYLVYIVAMTGAITALNWTG